MKKLKVNWPAIIALAIVLGIMQEHNDRVGEEKAAAARKPKIESVKFDDEYIPSDKYRIEEIMWEEVAEEQEEETAKTK